MLLTAYYVDKFRENAEQPEQSDIELIDCYTDGGEGFLQVSNYVIYITQHGVPRRLVVQIQLLDDFFELTLK